MQRRVGLTRSAWVVATTSADDEIVGNLVITIDPRSPLRNVLGARPWAPRTSMTTAVRAVPSPDPSRLVTPLG